MKKKIFFLDIPYMRNKFYFYAEHNTMRKPSVASRNLNATEYIKVCKRSEENLEINHYINNISLKAHETLNQYKVFEGYEEYEGEELYFHYHNMAELSIILSGEGYYFVEGKAIKVKAGSVIFFNSLVPHAWDAPIINPPEQITFSFYPSLLLSDELEKKENESLHNFFYHTKYLIREGEEAKRHFDTCKLIYEEYIKKQEGYDMLIKYSLISFFIYAMRNHRGNTEHKRVKVRHEELDQALNYMKSYFHRKITLEEVAKTVYMHPNYFSTVFKQKYGISFIHYINNLRLDMASELMKSTQLSLEEIAMRCGFSSISNFYKHFKKVYGISPGRYMK